jgi:4-hydroxy-4-methyl-2-oxoglutarate aldolase
MEDSALIDALCGLSTATLHEVMDKRNTLSPAIRPLWTPLRLCGPAFTVQARPGDNLATHWALSVAPAGSVLVISHEGDTSCAGWGEITSAAALARGLRGLVTDGVVRDTEACRRLGFPIFCQGVSIKGTSKAYAGALNVPIVCGGALVVPGDYIVADEDGVVVVPPAEAGAIVRKARQRETHEAEILERLRAGELTIDLLGLRGKLPQ